VHVRVVVVAKIVAKAPKNKLLVSDNMAKKKKKKGSIRLL
jgi:hypothetical protein